MKIKQDQEQQYTPQTEIEKPAPKAIEAHSPKRDYNFEKVMARRKLDQIEASFGDTRDDTVESLHRSLLQSRQHLLLKLTLIDPKADVLENDLTNKSFYKKAAMFLKKSAALEILTATNDLKTFAAIEGYALKRLAKSTITEVFERKSSKRKRLIENDMSLPQEEKHRILKQEVEFEKRTQAMFDKALSRERAAQIVTPFNPAPLRTNLNNIAALTPSHPMPTKEETQIQKYSSRKGSVLTAHPCIKTDSKSTIVTGLLSALKFTISKVRKPIAHIIMSFKKDVEISDEELEWRAKRSLVRLGVDLDQQPFVIMKHQDKDRIEAHVLYSRVRLDGKVHSVRGPDHILHLESSLLDMNSGLSEGAIKPLTARSKWSHHTVKMLSKGTSIFQLWDLSADKESRREAIPLFGPEAQIRLDNIGEFPVTVCGGFSKHQTSKDLEHSKKLIRYVLG
jgi:hypothetical protein